MIIYLGADHRGFGLKEQIKSFLKNEGYETQDMGAESLLPDDDYYDYAKAVAEKVSADPEGSRGILFCASGVGMDITANKFSRVRSALALSPDHAMASRNDTNTNILSLAADYLEPETVKRIVSVWLQTPFSGEKRHKRRVEKLNNLDRASQ
jgi:RpiB/LacA/LacB family sugar-phosphate isomerase